MVLIFSPDFILVGGGRCVIIDDSYYDNLMALVYSLNTNSGLTSSIR